MLDRFDLKGRVALVTGAVRGLGLEIARAFGEAGARVYINGSDQSRAEFAAERLRKENLDVLPMVFDVADEAAGDAALSELFARQGRLDILVNNVGARFRKPIEKIGSAELAKMLDINLIAAFVLSKRCAAMMIPGQYGRIINISSTAGQRGRTGDAAYIISKGGLNALTRALAAEYGPHGITCNTIVAGTFLTETNEGRFTSESALQWFQNRVLLQRAGQPPEIAGAALFLASPAASYVTGITLPVDGGYLIAGQTPP